MTDEPKKGKTIKHKLSTMRKHPMRWLTEFCLLSTYDYTGKGHSTPLVKAGALQAELRYQYYRMITEQPDQRQKLTYCLNCRPSGFKSEPYSIACKTRRVCPWCFVRKLYVIYEELLKPEPKIRNLHQLVIWRRTSPFGEPLPFFKANNGPHQWCQSAVTVQMAVPFLDPNDDRLIVNNVGFMVIPKGFDFQQQFVKRRHDTGLKLLTYGTPSPNSVIKGTKDVLSLPWQSLLQKKKLGHFKTLFDCYPGKKLLRINRYKPKGETCAN